VIVRRVSGSNYAESYTSDSCCLSISFVMTVGFVFRFGGAVGGLVLQYIAVQRLGLFVQLVITGPVVGHFSIDNELKDGLGQHVSPEVVQESQANQQTAEDVVDWVHHQDRRRVDGTDPDDVGREV